MFWLGQTRQRLHAGADVTRLPLPDTLTLAEGARRLLLLPLFADTCHTAGESGLACMLLYGATTTSAALFVE